MSAIYPIEEPAPSFNFAGRGDPVTQQHYATCVFRRGAVKGIA
ncbi:MAG: hypothetical protein JWO59_1700 [Chloroflexi bacterium]|nr:hypothetical protein [Chloroflexota bacterium]